MSKRMEGQLAEVEAFSSLGTVARQENPFSVSSFSVVGAGQQPSTVLSARFLEPPFVDEKLQAQMKPLSPISSVKPTVNKQQQVSSSSSKKPLHSHLQIASSHCQYVYMQGAPASHQAKSQNTSAQNQHFSVPCSNHSINGNSSLLATSHQHLRNEIHELGCARTIPKPTGVITGIFNCWHRNKEKSGTFQHALSRQRLDKLSPPVLAQQTRLQKEALAETQDTCNLWEWQMEQQQAITTQEHNLLERNTMENPLKVLPELMRRNSSANRSTTSAVSLLGQLACTSSNGSICEETRDNATGREYIAAGDAVKEGTLHHSAHSKASASGCGVNASATAGPESPTWDVHSQLNDIWHDADAISAMMLLFESALLRCRAEVAYFCRVYMQQMVLSGYALIRTLMEMEPNTVFARKVHASYALEGHVHMVMFRFFENDSFDRSGVTHILDPGARAAARAEEYLRMKGLDAEEALRSRGEAYNEAFHAYCAVKSEEVMGMFPWMSMGYRNAAERDRFMEAFLRAAKWVWLLHRLANCTHPPMHILRVGRGHVIDPAYVESVCVPSIGTCPTCPAISAPKVEFMIMPGFISPSHKIFRCKAYQHYMCKRSSQ